MVDINALQQAMQGVQGEPEKKGRLLPALGMLLRLAATPGTVPYSAMLGGMEALKNVPSEGPGPGFGSTISNVLRQAGKRGAETFMNVGEPGAEDFGVRKYRESVGAPPLPEWQNVGIDIASTIAMDPLTYLGGVPGAMWAGRKLGISGPGKFAPKATEFPAVAERIRQGAKGYSGGVPARVERGVQKFEEPTIDLGRFAREPLGLLEGGPIQQPPSSLGLFEPTAERRLLEKASYYSQPESGIRLLKDSPIEMPPSSIVGGKMLPMRSSTTEKMLEETMSRGQVGPEMLTNTLQGMINRPALKQAFEDVMGRVHMAVKIKGGKVVTTKERTHTIPKGIEVEDIQDAGFVKGGEYFSNFKEMQTKPQKTLSETLGIKKGQAKHVDTLEGEGLTVKEYKLGSEDQKLFEVFDSKGKSLGFRQIRVEPYSGSAEIIAGQLSGPYSTQTKFEKLVKQKYPWLKKYVGQGVPKWKYYTEPKASAPSDKPLEGSLLRAAKMIPESEKPITVRTPNFKEGENVFVKGLGQVKHTGYIRRMSGVEWHSLDTGKGIEWFPYLNKNDILRLDK